MSALTVNVNRERKESDLIAYNGGSGYNYYKGAMVIKQGASWATIIPLATAGASSAKFLGVNEEQINLTAGLGSSNGTLKLWTTGEFTFSANGTGVTNDIGLRAYGLDDNTVGNSLAQPAVWVGIITGIPDSTHYRVLIDQAIGALGASFVTLNQKF